MIGGAPNLDMMLGDLQEDMNKQVKQIILKLKSSHYFVFCILNSVVNIFVNIKIYIIRLSRYYKKLSSKTGKRTNMKWSYKI